MLTDTRSAREMNQTLSTKVQHPRDSTLVIEMSAGADTIDVTRSARMYVNQVCSSYHLIRFKAGVGSFVVKVTIS